MNSITIVGHSTRNCVIEGWFKGEVSNEQIEEWITVITKKHVTYRTISNIRELENIQ